MKKLLWLLPVLMLVSVMYLFYQKSNDTEKQVAATSDNTVSAQQNKQKTSKLANDYQNAVNNAGDRSPSTQSEKTADTDGIIPERIIIPSLQVDAAVEQVGLSKDGQMEVPSTNANTALYKDGPKPGETGNAVIDGHVDSYKGPAVFFYLKDLKKGDKVYVQDKKGKKLTFQVVQKKSYPMDDAPLTDIFGYAGQPMLNLITCTGTFDHEQKTHIDRLVVYTKLVK